MNSGSTVAIAVAIVNYNTREHLRACLTTVQEELPCQTIVVDNASSDGSVEMVRECFPQVVLHANTTNSGYGAAVNQAISSCTADYVLLLNSDTLLDPGTLQALKLYMDQHPRAAIVGPRLLNADRTLQASCYSDPTPVNIFLEESTLGRLIRWVPVLRNHYLRTWSHSEPRVVPWVLGAALGIRRDAFLAVGGFEAAFFMYFEEVDLCYRLRATGWEIHFAQVATIVHVGGASTSQRRPHMLRLVFASAAVFYRQHYSAGRLLQLRAIVIGLMLARSLRDVILLVQTQDTVRQQRLRENMLIWPHILHDARSNWNHND